MDAHDRRPRRADDPDRREVQHRRAQRRDDARRHRRRLPHPPVRDVVHGRRQGLRPVLRVPEPVHLRDARPHPGRQPPGPLRRVGGRRPLLVPAHRLLVRERGERGRGQEGVHREPHRRLRPALRDVPARPLHGRARLERHGQRRHAAWCTRASPGASTCGPSAAGSTPACLHFLQPAKPFTISAATAVGPRPLAGLHGKERADPALRVAPGRDGRPHAGVRAHPRGHDGHGGRLPHLPAVVRVRALAVHDDGRRDRRRRDGAARGDDRRSSRTTSRRSSPTPP